MYKCFFLFVLFSIVQGQQSDWVLRDSLLFESEKNINHIAIDATGSVYWLENQMVVKKRAWDGFHKKWGKKKSFSNRIPIEKLTIENTLFVVLKYSSAQLQLLDNQLVLIQDPISFPLESGINPLLTHIQDNNLLWAYDPIENRLLQWNYRLQKTQKVKNLFDKRKKVQIDEILYHNRSVYLRTAETLFVLDEQLNETSTLSISECHKIKLNAKEVWCLKPTGELIKNPQKKASQTSFWEAVTDFDVRGDFLAIRKDKVVYLYQFKPKQKKQ